MGNIRKFTTGATRSNEPDRLDYEGFLSPLALEQFARYMHQHRKQADGTMRDSDNWQNLFGEKHLDVCMKSLCRHVVDARLAHRGYKSEQPIIDSLNAIIFNAKAYLLKLLLDEENYQAAVDHETKPGYGGNA